MKQKIHILINEEARRLGLFYGFWNWFFIFQKDLLDLNIKVNFFSSMNDKFFDADHLFLNSMNFEITELFTVPFDPFSFAIPEEFKRIQKKEK